MGWRRLVPLCLVVALAAAVVPAPGAQAAFHIMKVREVHPGGASGGSYVMLQMYASGQNLVAGHQIAVYSSAGTATHTFTFPSNVASGANQATILVAGSGYATAFPLGPAPDATDAGLSLPASGGAVCFESIDCVAWGSFGGGSLPSPAGTPASSGGVSTGKALHRQISGGSCTNQLDGGDDSNDSAADFAEQDPHPRSNSSPIEEGSSCTAPPPAPSVTIESKPPSPTNQTSAAFSYSSSQSGSTFECSLDFAGFSSCPSTGIAYPGPLSEATHTFRVRATNSNGTGTPASYQWVVDLTAPAITITEMPADPSAGSSAAFSYQADETVSGVECRLDTPEGAGAFQSCPVGGRTYSGLADGLHAFMVRATDLAGNQGSATEYGWTVDNSLADTTPPQTTLLSTPPNPSGSSAASFAYSSNEPGSSFECRLDAAAFAACPPTGIAYAGLAAGTHTFQVRARDAEGNVDPTPAGYTWDVVLAAPSPSPSPPPPPATAPQPPPPGTAIAAAIARVTGPVAVLTMRCRGVRGAHCKGVLRLIVRAGGARSSRRGARRIVIARARYRIPAGGRRLVRARLNGRGKRLLRRAGRRGLRARLVGSGTRNRVVRLIAERSGAKRNRGGRRRGR